MAPWMSEGQIELYVSDYCYGNPRVVFPSRRLLRDILLLTNLDREKHRLWQIPPHNMNDRQLEQQRKHKKELSVGLPLPL
jgi:hypothetical protein